jgi:hypothetical protein
MQMSLQSPAVKLPNVKYRCLKRTYFKTICRWIEMNEASDNYLWYSVPVPKINYNFNDAFGLEIRN